MPALLPHVAVITVSYNSSRQLDEFLGSIEAQHARPALVVIADNASVDLPSTREIATKHGAEVHSLETNRGYGGAINAAVAALPPEITVVLISNPDVILSPDALAELELALDRDRSLGAVGPKLLNEDGSVYPSARSLPSLRTGIGHAVLGRSWPTNPWTKAYRADHRPSNIPRDAGWLSGACLLVRRSAFEQVGGFDEGYFMYFEDVDLGRRLLEAGWRNRYEPSTEVTHVGGLSTATESTLMLRAHHESAVRYLNRRYAGPLLAPVRLTLRISLRIRSRLLERRNRTRR